MISVLIPAYNYSIVELVKELHEQLTNCKLQFEIICLEDGSDKSFVDHNSTIKNLSNTSIILSAINKGRIKTRQLLSESAKYEWLLFLDADVMPKSKDFISNYITLLNLKHEVIYGGFAYSNIPPTKDRILRWKYGRNKEQRTAKNRNHKPYKITISANFLIEKSIFVFITSGMNAKGYGNDNYFGALLKENKVDVFHIDNEVYHLGLETNEIYLKKIEQSIENLIQLYKKGKIKDSDNTLLIFFETLEYIGLHHVLSLIYRKFNLIIKKNLLGNNPSIPLLQFYKLTYICYLDTH